jgi:hypothetical protein
MGGGTNSMGGGSTTGPITGGPCQSGGAGVSALRVSISNSGGTAHATVAHDGLPQSSTSSAGVYGYSIGYAAPFVDMYLGSGGVALDSDNFLDVSLSTQGLSTIDSATVAIFGRSYNTTASGSFSWQTFDDVGSTPVDFVSNVAPYQWYATDLSTGIGPNEGSVLLRIKAGPGSDSIVVHALEICIDAT